MTNTALHAVRPARHTLDRYSRLMLLGVLLLAAGMRFYALDASSLWSDEGNTWALIQRSFGEIVRDAAADIHPPGYYWLLKLWAMLFGSSAASMRAFSALAGVALVGVVYGIGKVVDRHIHNERRDAVALTAAVIAALNPFQIYYSQEARMYMLLALCGAGLFWALLLWMERERASLPVSLPLCLFVISGALGLWTHYSFPILLSAAGLAYLWHWRMLLANRQPVRAIARYTLANLVIVLLFAPWLPTAIDRVLNWPQGGEPITWFDGVRTTLRIFVFGPLTHLPEPQWPWLVTAAVLPLLGLLALVRSNQNAPPVVATLALWLLAPVLLMFALGLFSDAFLKFLLTASPAWAILSAAAPTLLPWPRWGSMLVTVGAVATAIVTLPIYYTSPTARDNYAGVAAYIEAVGDPTTDLVLLNAPGQGDVWRYYAPDLPVIGLPQSRPPDPAATTSLLEQSVQDRRHVFALLWATDEADPNRLVESWLDQHAFRGLESWQGNLRFVVYTLPNQLACDKYAPSVTFGDAIQLVGQCQPAFPQRVPAGQVAIVGLQWQTQQRLSTRYKVTVQLLDARHQVIAQHDAEPAGGSQPTDEWEPATTVADNHGLTIPFGAPPGIYQLIAALYDPATGQRLPTPTGDAFALGQIEVTRPTRALPLALIDMQHRIDAPLGPVILAGYSAYKKDHSFAPDTPLQTGDLVHFTFYWQAPDPLPEQWEDDLVFTLTLGNESMRAPLAGGAYPTAQWQPGEIIRGEFDLLYDGSERTPSIDINGQRRTLRSLPR